MHSLTDKQFTEIVLQSLSVSDVVVAMGRARVGTNYQLVRDRISALGLDTSHWRGKASSERVPLELQLCRGSRSSRGALKKKLIREGLLINHCALCGRPPEWEGKPLMLRLDHLNGVNDDNRLENLRLLCPNCDSQTDTYCGRNKKAGRKRACECGTLLARKSLRCKHCQDKMPRPTKIQWPSTEELAQLAKELGYAGCGRMLGVSDNAVRRRLIKQGSLVQR